MNTNAHELILKEEVYQIVGAATGKPVGLLLNFGAPKLEWKRMVFSQPNIRVHSRSFAVETEGENRE
ncbi:MAG: hypothetical protein KJZ93_01275 [Caldilineaceae bacterium]|nr:hypothetical protein [Caldilineaceae bacterium]